MKKYSGIMIKVIMLNEDIITTSDGSDGAIELPGDPISFLD